MADNPKNNRGFTQQSPLQPSSQMFRPFCHKVALTCTGHTTAMYVRRHVHTKAQKTHTRAHSPRVKMSQEHLNSCSYNS